MSKKKMLPFFLLIIFHTTSFAATMTDHFVHFANYVAHNKAFTAGACAGMVSVGAWCYSGLNWSASFTLAIKAYGDETLDRGISEQEYRSEQLIEFILKEKIKEPGVECVTFYSSLPAYCQEYRQKCGSFWDNLFLKKMEDDLFRHLYIPSSKGLLKKSDIKESLHFFKKRFDEQWHKDFFDRQKEFYTRIGVIAGLASVALIGYHYKNK